MDPLARFAALLADRQSRLTGTCGEPLSLAAIRQVVLPYRQCRRELDLASSEDYDLLLLRLASGEGALARLQPPDVMELLRLELLTPHPDLSLLEVHADAQLALQRTVPLEEFAPPVAAPPRAPTPPAPGPAVVPPEPARRCSGCGGPLPAGRAVRFCPWCGAEVGAHTCRCGAVLQPGWRHCVDCGAATGR